MIQVETVEETQTTPEEGVCHLVCCKIPVGEYIFTTALCGYADIAPVNPSSPLPECAMCVEIGDNSSYCPEYGTCTLSWRG